MLRNHLLGSQRNQYSTLSGREALVAIAIKAWNAWRERKTLQTRIAMVSSLDASLFGMETPPGPRM
jgi:hypothetical protein